jgi:ATP-dependent Clp endopeptidase proteolytic subunit ClpP
VSRNTPWRTTRRQYALSQGSNDWYRIRNQAGGPTQLYIYDEIGYFGVGAGDLQRDLADVTGPIEVHLNSPGGEVFDGITIYNTLLARKDPVVVKVDGLAASIASVIAMAGTTVEVARQSQMMIHDGHGMAIGNAQDMRDLAEILDRTSNTIAEIYSQHTGKPVDYWRQLMKAETWYSAQEAIDTGLADRFIDNGAGRTPSSVDANWDLSIFRGGARFDQKGAAHHGWQSPTEPHHEPVTGQHYHNHASFGNGDGDDGIHAHAHSHDGHGNASLHDHPHTNHSHSHGHDGAHQHAHEVGMDAYGPHEHMHTHHAGLEDGDGHISAPDGTETPHNLAALEVLGFTSEILARLDQEIRNWNAAAAMAKCHSASDFRSICAGEHTTGEPDTQAHWALPHHNSPGAGPDKGGVVAALGRWNQTENLKNKQGALSHLKAHARSLGLPSGDEDNRLDLDMSDEDITKFVNAIRL